MRSASDFRCSAGSQRRVRTVLIASPLNSPTAAPGRELAGCLAPECACLRRPAGRRASRPVGRNRPAARAPSRFEAPKPRARPDEHPRDFRETGAEGESALWRAPADRRAPRTRSRTRPSRGSRSPLNVSQRIRNVKLSFRGGRRGIVRFIHAQLRRIQRPKSCGQEAMETKATGFAPICSLQVRLKVVGTVPGFPLRTLDSPAEYVGLPFRERLYPSWVLTSTC